ncbi:acyl-CoA thioesterase [Zoogloeaceae bacterium G21618-S1]|nr:acyl-CoA thioesterase [Zoogloeaceae bacterium G21618-S1]
MTHDTQICNLPDDRDLALRVMPMPADTNPTGDVFGGWIAAQVDIAGAIPARRRACGRVATISIDSFLFKQPVSVGDLLSFYATIVKEGRTSITIAVEVYAERHPEDPVVVKVTEAKLTYVSVDNEGKKRPLPSVTK